MATNDPTRSQHSPSPLGFPLLVATLALIIAIGAMLAVAFKLNDNNSGSGSASGGAAHIHGSMMGGNGNSMMGAAANGSGKVEEVVLVVKSDEEHAKNGPEGTWHDAYLPADFTVRPGATVRVTVRNYDEGEHSFTSMPLGLNVTVAAGSAKKPAVTTFTFVAPSAPGSYLWYCDLPCDPWAMSHLGYMRGYVKVA